MVTGSIKTVSTASEKVKVEDMVDDLLDAKTAAVEDFDDEMKNA